MKKFILLSVIMAFMFCAFAEAAYYDEGNDGDSWETAYVIRTADDLIALKDRVGEGTEDLGKYYVLASDIDLTSETNWGGIGSTGSGNRAFTGHFDGQGYTVTLNSRHDSLFNTISADNDTIAVRNLNVAGSIGNNGGGLAWELTSGIIENCSFTGTIGGNGYIMSGGLVEWMRGGIIRNCTVSADISSEGDDAGGIVASLSGGIIDNCTVEAGTIITASDDAGGIAAYVLGGTITNCTVEDGVSITGSRTGGIAGHVSSGVNLSGNTWPSVYSESGSGSDSSGGGNPSDDETDDNESDNNTLSNTPQITWNKHRYQVYNENLTWDEAKSRCESLGGHIVTITSTLEQAQIESLLRQSRTDFQSYWLGASADVKGMWHWVTDEVFEKQYVNYASGQPDGSGNYLCMYWNINGTNVASSAIDTVSNSGKWDDTTINGSDTGITSHGFICEWDDEQEAIEEAPAASDFQTWQANPDAWRGDTDSGIPSGANPSPVDTSHLSENPANIQAVTLPVSYDARKENILLPVRRQGVFDTCWAFAALGAMETDYMKQGLTSLGTSPDLSELHLAWFAYRDPSTDKYQTYVNRANILMEGGDPETAEAFLRRVDVSPVDESEMPYTEAGEISSDAEQKVKAFINGRNSNSFKKANISLVIDETAVIGNISQNYTNDTEKINRIKNQIIKHGALYFRYGNDERGYNDDKTSYYSISKNGYYHHAALIVGWDDDYPASNFKNNPGVNGAWLVRTSRWNDKETGEPFNVGDDEYGCFWMSYAQAGEGTGLADIRSFSVREESPAVRQNGESVPTKNITSAWCARIFRAERDERLIRISFNTTDNNARYQLFVNKLGKEKPTDPGRAENPLHSEEVAYAGYHTITLSSPVDLYEGDYYSVVVKMTLSPASEYRYPTAVEASLDHYIEVSADFGESFFAEGDEVPSVWQDGKDIDNESYKACITTYTEERITYDTEPSITTNSLPEARVNESYNFILSSTGTQRIEWRSGNVPEDFALSREGVLTGNPTKAGQYDINFTALNDVGYVEKTLSLTVKSSAEEETPPEQETKHEDEKPAEDIPVEETPSEDKPEDTEPITGVYSSNGGCSSGICVLGLVLVFCVRGKRV